MAPGCDPGSDSGAWTLDHCAQLLHHRNTRRPSVDLAARKTDHQRKEKRNHVRATGLLLRWQKTPLIEPKSRTIPSHILWTRGRRAGLKGTCRRQQQDRLTSSNSAEQCPAATFPHPTSTFSVNPFKSRGSLRKFSCKTGKSLFSNVLILQRERAWTGAELLSKAQWGGLTCNHRCMRTLSTEVWQLVGHERVRHHGSLVSATSAFKFLWCTEL